MWALLSIALAQCLIVEGNTPSGDLQQIRMEGGKIVEVGTRVSPTGCALAQLPPEAILTPGLVQLNSSVGMAEVDMEDATVENAGEGDDVRATLKITEAYNPASVRIPVVRLGGATSVVVVPNGGLIAGQAGWARLTGSTQREAIVNDGVAMVASVEGKSLAQQLGRLEELLEDARIYEANAGKVRDGAFRSFPEGVSLRELMALLPVVHGEQPLLIGADRASDIEAILRMAERQQVRVIVNGGAEAWKLREELARTKTPVIVDPFVYGAGRFDQLHGRADNPALLAEAGVLVMFSSWSHNAPIAAQLAGNAVRGGMSHQEALDAITINPGLAFGLPEYTGLKVGNAADLVAWSGDPLEIGSRPLLVVVKGVAQPMDSRQRALFRRYRDLPGSPLPPLSLPME